MQEFLRSTEAIDFEDPAIRALARELGGSESPAGIAARCFLWVRDRIRHSVDHNDERVTVAASEVLREGTGMCYAKSHLLAALLRANHVPCGFVYQRLAVDESGKSFCLHGLNAVWLPECGWYRVDPRGDRIGIATSFDPPKEQLAFAPNLPGECTIDERFADPLPEVLAALKKHHSVKELCMQLPDWNAQQSAARRR